MYKVSFFTLAAALFGHVATGIDLNQSISTIPDAEDFSDLLAQEVSDDLYDYDSLSEINAQPPPPPMDYAAAAKKGAAAPEPPKKPKAKVVAPPDPYPHKHMEKGKLRVHIDTHPRDGRSGLTAQDVKNDILNAPPGDIIIDAGASGGIHPNLKKELAALAASGDIKPFKWALTQHPTNPDKFAGASYVRVVKN